jgi:hypothetical protein
LNVRGHYLAGLPGSGPSAKWPTIAPARRTARRWLAVIGWLREN